MEIFDCFWVGFRQNEWIVFIFLLPCQLSPIYFQFLLQMQNQLVTKKQGKKPSLFKQKIKQAKPVGSDLESFPVPVKIDLTQSPLSDGHKEQISQLQQKRFSQRLMESLLKPNQIEQISQQNMKAISQMTDQQIRKYQEMIIKQLPSGFVKKLNPGRFIKEKEMIKQVQQSPADEPHSITPPADNIPEKVDQSIPLIDPPGSLNEGTLGCLENLVFNIINNQVIFFPSDVGASLSEQQFVKMKTLKQMIESENNQTQIVASQITRKLYYDYKRFIPLTLVSGQPFHLTMLSHDVYKWLIKSILYQLRRTNFKTCWMQLLECLQQCVKLISRWIRKSKQGQEYLGQIKQSIVRQLNRRQQFVQTKTNEKISLIQKLKNVVQQMSQNKKIQEVSCEKWINLSSLYSHQILDLILLEQLSPSTSFPTLLTSISHLCAGYYQPQSGPYFSFLIQFTYPLALCLQSRNMKFNKANLEICEEKQLIYAWFSYQMGHQPLSLVFSPHSTYMFSEQFCFKCLHLTKMMNEKQYGDFVNMYLKQSKGKKDKESLVYHLVLLNLNEYFEGCESEQEYLSQIQTINSMVRHIGQSIKKQSHYLKQICPQIFLLLFKIFQTSYETTRTESEAKYRISYQSLDQQNLQQLFNLLCSQIIMRAKEQYLWFMIPEERVKSIIDSYNFNSYGNYCFSKAILFLLATCANKGTSHLLIDQLLLRYPFLFYYSAETGLFGGQSIYLNGNAKPQLNSIYEIIKTNPKVREENLFVKFLRAQ